jgi:hypothetical protein
MYTDPLRSVRSKRRIRPLVLVVFCSCFILSISSCSYFYELTIRGVIRDAQTNEPIADAAVGATTIIEGQIVGEVLAVDERGLPYGIPTDTNGAFAVIVSQSSRPARPDRIQLIIVRDGCEQRLMIEINEDTAHFVEVESSLNAVEITDPILVPACEPSP